MQETLKNKTQDGVWFEILKTKDINIENYSKGIEIELRGHYLNIKEKIKIDFVHGDVITPSANKYEYSALFSNKNIPNQIYPFESIFSEKLQAFVFLGDKNTRIKDLYDLYLIIYFYENKLDKNNLISAINKTFTKRKTKMEINEIISKLKILKLNDNHKILWDRYCKNVDFSLTLEYQSVVQNVIDFLEILI